MPDNHELSLEDLAGATLDRVVVDWRNGIVLVTLLNVTKHDESCALRATEITRVEIPRGASASKTVKSATRTGSTLVVEMESGESLRVESKSLAIDLLGG